MIEQKLKRWLATISTVFYQQGYINVHMLSGIEIKFPIAGNKRLAGANADELNNIEISPRGLHWSQLDEDLSLAGLVNGDYGQQLINSDQER